MDSCDDGVQVLLEANANLHEKDFEGGTVFFAACFCGQDQLLESLIEMNVAVDGLVNTPNGQGETPLHWSTKNGHDAVSRILIEQRADVEQKFAGEDVEAAQSALEWALESHGQLALHWAAKTGRAGVDARSNVDWAF